MAGMQKIPAASAAALALSPVPISDTMISMGGNGNRISSVDGVNFIKPRK